MLESLYYGSSSTIHVSLNTSDQQAFDRLVSTTYGTFIRERETEMTYTPVIDEEMRQRFIAASAPEGIWVDYTGDLRVVQVSPVDGRVTILGHDGGDRWSSYNNFATLDRALESYGGNYGRVISQDAPAEASVSDPDAEIRQRFINAGADPEAVWIYTNAQEYRIVRPSGLVDGIYHDGSLNPDVNSFTSQGQALMVYGPGGSSYQGRIISHEAPGTPAAPVEGVGSDDYITKAQLQEVMRELAIENNWCSDHHRPMEQLGVEPIGIEYAGELTIKIPVKLVTNAGMRDYYSDRSTSIDLEDAGFSYSSTRRDQQIKSAIESALTSIGVRTSQRNGHWHMDTTGIRHEVSQAERWLQPATAV